MMLRKRFPLQPLAERYKGCNKKLLFAEKETGELGVANSPVPFIE